MSLIQVIHRIASDQPFAIQFAQDPASALASVGLDLSDEERRAIQTLMSRPDWQNLCSPAQAEIESYPWMSALTASPESCSRTSRT